MGSIEGQGGALPESIRNLPAQAQIDYVRERLETAYSRVARWEDVLVRLTPGTQPKVRPRQLDWIEEAAALRDEGLSYREIVERIDGVVSYEAVRRALLRRGAAKGRNPVKQAQQAAGAQQQLYERFEKQAEQAVPCAVCGYWTLRWSRGHGVHRTCSEECAQAWLLFRLHLDPAEHQRHRQLVARRSLEVGADPVRVRHAKRVFAGTVESRGLWITSEAKINFLLTCSGAVRRALEKVLPAPSAPLRERLGVA